MSRVTIMFLFAVIACTETVTAPPRPGNVPQSAVWAGGVDGGAWIDCRFIYKEPFPAYECSTFNDDGTPWTIGTYVLVDVRRAGATVSYAPKGELARVGPSEYLGFSGTFVHLTGDRALVPHGTIDSPFPDGGGKRAEYELGVEKSEVQYESDSRPTRPLQPTATAPPSS
jgi:hypothetical protein